MDHVGRRGRPPLVVAVVLGAHALLLLAMLRITLTRDDAAGAADTAILLLGPDDFAAPALEAPVEPERPDAPPTTDAATSPQTPELAAAPASGAQAATATGAVSGGAAAGNAPRGPVDWYRVGESVARDRVARAAAAARTPRAPFRKAQEGPRSTIFDSGKRRRTGTSEKLADGQSIFWINENCFVTTESDSLLQKDLHDAQRGMTRCVMRLGKREARGDLFDKLPNHERKLWPGDPTLPDSRGGTGPGGVPEPIPEPQPNAELEIIDPDSR